MWCWSKRKEAAPGLSAYAAGIKFPNLTEPFRSVVRQFCHKQLYNERLRRRGGFSFLLAEIEGMSRKGKARALQILAGRRFIHTVDGLKTHLPGL